MKKLFNYALLAAALLVGVNVNAQTFSIKQGANESFENTLKDAVNAVVGTEQATITVNNDYTMACTDHKGEVITIDGGKDIILDLNGNEITMETSNWKSHFEINNGKLHLVSLKENSIGSLKLYGVYSDSGDSPEYEDYTNGIPNKTYNYYGIQLIGSNEQLAPGTEYSKLQIDENVNYTHEHNGYAIQVKYAPKKDNKYYSEGVVLEIEGAVKGGWSALTINGTIQETYGEGENKVYVHVAPTGSLIGGNFKTHSIATAEIAEIKKYYVSIGKDATEAERIAKEDYVTGQAGLYAAGLGKYLIEGKVEGGIGIYAKAGNIELKNATVRSIADEYWHPICWGNGYLGNGSAIVFDSNSGYANDMSVVINGETKVEAVTGYAIEEIVTSGTDHMSGEDFVINSGTFKGGEEGCLSVTAELGEDVKVQGTITGGTYNENIIDLLSNVDGIITPSKDENGNDIYVVGTKPSGTVWKNTIGSNAEDYVKLPTGVTQTLSAGGKAAYLVEEGTAVVTIPAGKTLEVGEIVMSKESQIIVEKGAKLIVKGNKGIVANQASNIVLKSEAGAPAYFLLDPAVTSNKTPKATVNYKSGAYKASEGQFVFDFFGAPMGTVNKVTSSTTDYDAAFSVNDNATNWTTIGYLMKGVEDDMHYELFSRPFGFFEIQSNNPSDKLITYTFEGNVFGNSSPEVAFQNGWPGFSNAYTGDINVDAFFNYLDNLGFEGAVYTYTQVGNNTLVWTANNPIKDDVKDLAPMQAFMLRNADAAKKLAVDYTQMVWNPAMDIEPVGAPRRSNIEKATVRIEGANGIFDELTVAQDESFDANCKYNAEKYMNSELNLYVKGEKNLAIAATDNLDNTFVGFNCKKAGKYTISFENVTGNFALVDTKTNAHIAMAEGTTYEFIANAGEDAYRFMIVRGAQAPTDMQKTNAAVKANKALVNGQIVISNGERFFNVLGNEVK